LLVGWSTGAALVAAERTLTALGRLRPPSTACVVVIAPDSGMRYLSEADRLAGTER
jgi:cysteine synthase